ncbi:MAG: Ditrans,polycis-undecaprenyl-diphosphate synthase ((2E,6E)-farnesyl-diphosphate specific) [Chlamydiia bacterium]|nr:Ditrans,polycis-undecaprenyl-diphosphate synthase ((2E,6E)-farnesyl-diphosphate specific) [Chlamydiia bacterium]MCH9616507.1 Ditrans,polycis-undecaprenyl-diphosphate synthase ((2E,6E)-farnesyl-diphosphate specific) [Chlamydiia bacterium]MCH9629507.1 Ditrans,polycis-undecaprenyl-diphosphate synthase ((2E,6E)-farnesyl-diphosphate specific) [Chlamydiia bacterium]
MSQDLPKHVAIIMDGNRRWAMEKKHRLITGHEKGAEILENLVEFAAKKGVEVITAYSFSTENWKRSPAEVKAIMRLFELLFVKKRDAMIEKGVKLSVVGDLEKLSPKLKASIDETLEATKDGTKIELVLALNYGSRNDIVKAVSKAAKQYPGQTLTEEQFSACLSTSKWSDPELLIRTGGELRLSNFLLWELSYAELVCTKTLWPEYTCEEFASALDEFSKRKRRFGI